MVVAEILLPTHPLSAGGRPPEYARNLPSGRVAPGVVVGAGSVERGDRGVLAGVLAGFDGQFLDDVGHRGALVAQRAGEEHVVLVEHLGAAAVVAACGGGLLAFEGFLADVVAVELGGDGEHGEEHGAHAVRVVNPGQRSGQQLQLHPAAVKLSGQGHQLGGVAGEAFHLMHAQDHRLVRRGGFDLVGEGEGLLEFGSDLDPGADLLGEHPRAVRGRQRVELALQLLLGSQH